MSFAYMPLYTGDYLRDTRHLTPTKHGVYLLLLMHCFDQKGPLPLDEQECAGIANCRSADEVDSLRYILERYFIRMDDGWYNRRMQAVIEKAESISRDRSEAGRKGFQARVKQLPNKSHALASNPNPNPIPTSTPSPSSTSEKTRSKALARATRLPGDWYPNQDLKAWAKTERPDLDVRTSIASFVDYWTAIPGSKGTKTDWDATFRNWIRRESAGKKAVKSGFDQFREELENGKD